MLKSATLGVLILAGCGSGADSQPEPQRTAGYAGPVIVGPEQTELAFKYEDVATTPEYHTVRFRCPHGITFGSTIPNGQLREFASGVVELTYRNAEQDGRSLLHFQNVGFEAVESD
jgi:hypothetical protein